jgi:malate dehydrogenase
MSERVIGIIGSGNVGANTAFFVVETGITDVLLYDVEPGVPTGKSLDMMEAAPIRKYRNRITPVSKLEDLAEAETIIVSAGKGRVKGQKRDDLLASNRDAIVSLAKSLRTIAKDACIVIATQPVDPLTTLFVAESGFPRRRVMGLGGVLDSTRFGYLISRELGISTENITALVIGRHTDDMICLPEYSRVSGVPITKLLEKDRIDLLVAGTRGAGDLIIELAERSSAYYAPSAALAEIAHAIHMNLNRIFSVSVVLDGEYGVKGAALSVPCIIGRNGIEKILTPALSSSEIERFVQSGVEVKRLVSGGAA